MQRHEVLHPATEATCWPQRAAGALWLAVHDGGTVRPGSWPELVLLRAAMPGTPMVAQVHLAMVEVAEPTVLWLYGGDWRRFDAHPWAPLTRFIPCTAEGVPLFALDHR